LETNLIFDILVIAFIFLSAIFAFSRGLSQEVLSLISWISAFFISYFFGYLLTDFTNILVSNVFISKIITYFLLFIFSLFLLSFLTKKFSNSVKKSTVGMLDRSLGFIFGIGRGYLLVSLCFFAFTSFYSDKSPKWIEDSKMSYLLMVGSVKIVSFFDKENFSAQILENRITKKSKQLFEKSIDSHIRREESSEFFQEGYMKKERENLEHLIENIE